MAWLTGDGETAPGAETNNLCHLYSDIITAIMIMLPQKVHNHTSAHTAAGQAVLFTLSCPTI